MSAIPRLSGASVLDSPLIVVLLWYVSGIFFLYIIRLYPRFLMSHFQKEKDRRSSLIPILIILSLFSSLPCFFPLGCYSQMLRWFCSLIHGMRHFRRFSGELFPSSPPTSLMLMWNEVSFDHRVTSFFSISFFSSHENATLEIPIFNHKSVPCLVVYEAATASFSA